MLLWIGLILLVAWLLGVTVFHAGGFMYLYIVLVIAVVVIAWHLIAGRR